MEKHGKLQRLEKFEIPKAVVLVSEIWTPESGLLTAAMKLKRKSLETAFASEILEMYSGNNNQAGAKKIMNNNLPTTANVSRV